ATARCAPTFRHSHTLLKPTRDETGAMSMASATAHATNLTSPRPVRTPRERGASRLADNAPKACPELVIARKEPHGRASTPEAEPVIFTLFLQVGHGDLQPCRFFFCAKYSCHVRATRHLTLERDIRRQIPAALLLVHHLRQAIEP